MVDEVNDERVQNDLPPESGTESPPHVNAHVTEWLERIRNAEKHHKPAFKRMRESMDIVAYGSDKEWDEAGNYTVPVIARHINLAVSQLYAKNPKAVVKRKRRMLHTVWDGNPESVIQLAMLAQQGDANAMMQLQAVTEDMQAAEQFNRMADGTAKTLEIVWDHVLDEQTLGTKQQLKALVRRTKTTGVGYVKLDFQREFEPSPKADERIQDSVEQISHLEQLSREAERGDIKEDSPEVAEMQATQTALQSTQPLIREGLVFSYPRSTRIIIDPDCDDLKTFAGARWVAEKLFMTSRQIEKNYGVKVRNSREEALSAFDRVTHEERVKASTLCVYEVQDRQTGTFFTVCEGHSDYLRPPALPPVFVERFFTIFPLVFNDIEHEKELFPASDVWRARHMQQEYNRSRESRREHRMASRPYWVARSGVLEEDEKMRLQTRSPHELIELQAMPDNQSVEQVLQRGPIAPIDPNLYEVETINGDILRTVGVQEANLGGLSGATATESSIAEASRTSSVADNVDDLDDLLTTLARAGGIVLLMEMSKEMVLEIAGPGAVWPDAPPTRQELSKELMLEVEAGSSGRPNKAADMANIERAAPFLLQLPDIDQKPIIRKFANLLDIDIDEMYRKGVLSVVAQNSLVGSATPVAGGPAPSAQGPQGSSSGTPSVASGNGPQAAFTQPGEQVVGGP